LAPAFSCSRESDRTACGCWKYVSVIFGYQSSYAIDFSTITMAMPTTIARGMTIGGTNHALMA
jgi:hypothetical protein